MRYSVYDYTRRQYDYYEAPGPGGTHAGPPPLVRSLGGLGATPEQASWKVPSGAHKIGSGPTPQGRIARLGGGLGLGDDLLGDPLRLGVAAVIAYVLWRGIR